MNYALKVLDTPSLMDFYYQQYSYLEQTPLKPDEEDEVRERIQDILEILNHRGVRMKL